MKKRSVFVLVLSILIISISLVSAGFWIEMWSGAIGKITGRASHVCVDSDGGSNYDVQGTVSSPLFDAVIDYCYSDGWVAEYTCGAFAPGLDYFQCSYGCLNGKCNPVPTAVCGNNILEVGESCDGTKLNSKTCVTQGFDSGTLGCNVDCSGFDTSNCISCVDSDGDGYGSNCDLGSDCDDNNANVNLGVSEVCSDNKDNNCDGQIDEGCTIEITPDETTPDEAILPEDNSLFEEPPIVSDESQLPPEELPSFDDFQSPPTETCKPEYSCTIFPEICPASGISIETCVDIFCGEQVTTTDIPCTPGKKSGLKFSDLNENKRPVFIKAVVKVLCFLSNPFNSEERERCNEN